MMCQQSILLSLCCLLLVEPRFTAGQSDLSACNCSFEQGLCQWVQGKQTDTQDWRRTAGPVGRSDSGPSVDHTFGNASGYYMYIDSSYGGKRRLLSPILHSNLHGTCLHFWYHMYGLYVESLNVYTRPSYGGGSFGNLTKVWTKQGNHGDQWLSAEVNMTSSSQYQTIFEGVSSFVSGVIGLDDIGLAMFPCRQVADLSACNCSFEQGLCQWVQDKQTDIVGWGRTAGPGYSDSGPSVDHTFGNATGYYVNIDTKYTHYGAQARLLSPILNSNLHGTCLHFWYHVYGRYVSSLNVYTRPSYGGGSFGNLIKVWTKQGDHGDQWLSAEVNMTSSSQYQIIFEGIIGSYAGLGAIGLDDIALAMFPCRQVADPDRSCPKSHHCRTTEINDETVGSFAEEWGNELKAAAGNVSSAENVTAIKERVVVFADALQQIKSNVTKIDRKVAQKLLVCVDIVSQLYSTVLEPDDDRNDTQNRIIQAVEVLGEKIVLDSAENGTVRLLTNNTALEVWNLSRVLDDDSMVSDEYTLGLQLKTVDGQPLSSISNESLHQITDTDRLDNSQTDIAIQIPASILQETLKENAGKDVRMSMSIFLTPSLFEHGTLERTEDKESTTKSLVLNSKVIMASITVDGEPFGKDRYVTTVYLPSDEYKDLSEEDHRRHSVCVFWDLLGAGGRGSWSDKGCHVDKLDKGRVVCACNHLTNFAVLFDLDFNQQSNNKKPTPDQRILRFVSIFGLGFSIVGLSCTVISFIAIRKWRKGRPQQIIFNMSLAMLFAWVIFLAGFSRVENRVACLAVAVLLHYFILASFIWMLVEAILQYMLIIKVTGNSFRHFMTKTVFPAWGLPLVPVIVLLSIDVEMYNGYQNYCWMSRNAFFFAFLIPVSLVMIFNIIVYVMVVVKLCRMPNVGRARSTGASRNLVSIRASIGAFVMLGLSWVFAYLTVMGAGGVFQYLFTITTTIQGLLIFLFFTARDPVVKAFWRQQFQKCRLAAAGTNCCCKGCRRVDPTQERAGTGRSHNTPAEIEMSQVL